MDDGAYDKLNTPGYAWVNTPGYGNYEVAGKPLHAVKEGASVSLCGIRRTLWSFDLFNVDRCKKCEKIYNRMKTQSDNK